MTAVCLLSPYLTLENVDEMIEAATHRRKPEIEEWLAQRFLLREIAGSLCIVSQLAPAQVGSELPEEVRADSDQLAPEQVRSGLPAKVGANCSQLAPGQVDPERLLVQVTIAKGTQKKLRYAPALLSHAIPTGDIAQVLDRALDALIAQLEKRKIGVGTRRRRSNDTSSSPSPSQQGAAGSRYIPAQVRRAVWDRDQGQCTFISAAGHRCATRRFLEFDHVEPVARGGRATVEGMRLRCRAHNQFEAERAFGADFMSRKRYEAHLAAAKRRAHPIVAETRALANAHEQAATRDRAVAKELTLDVLSGLRGLGCRADEARRAAEFSESLQDATLEERMRAALSFLSRRQRRTCSA